MKQGFMIEDVLSHDCPFLKDIITWLNPHGLLYVIYFFETL